MTNVGIGIIGIGTMGRAIAERLAAVPFARPVVVFDHDSTKITGLKAEAAESLASLVDRSAVIILAIKPQSLSELATELGDAVRDSMIISILAGVSTARLEAATRSQRIIRAMPNLAATVGASVTGWYATARVTSEERRLASAIFSTIGMEVELTDEASFDALTAVSGSGPGYLFYLAEQLVAAAEQLGFEPAQADELVRETIVGAAKLLEVDPRPFAELRQAVTSKGGTTEAALAVMAERGMPTMLSDALAAARDRSRSLGEQS